jgi:6-phosphogluconolactonase
MTIETISAQHDLDAAFNKVAQAIFRYFAEKPVDEPLVLGLCGGRSVVGLLQALRKASEMFPKEVIRRVHFFMVDERLVSLDDEQSNFGGLKKLLFDQLIKDGVIEPSQLHPFVPDDTQVDYGCARYSAELQSYGGRFTCVVLGVGEDGHVAGLFPRNAVLDRTDTAFVPFFDSPKPPSSRMTATKPLLAAAELALLLVLGETKRDAWNRFQDPATQLRDCPSVLVREMRTVLVVENSSQ